MFLEQKCSKTIIKNNNKYYSMRITTEICRVSLFQYFPRYHNVNNLTGTILGLKSVSL